MRGSATRAEGRPAPIRTQRHGCPVAAAPFAGRPHSGTDHACRPSPPRDVLPPHVRPSPSSRRLYRPCRTAAGAVNSVAGGGTSSSPSRLVSRDRRRWWQWPQRATWSPLWLAVSAGAWAFRELKRFSRSLPMFPVIALPAGIIVASCRQLATSNAAFAQLILWLLLFATVLFASARRSPRW